MSGDWVGAILATLQVIGALVLVFFLPGWLLVNVLYPRRGELDREYDALYRITLGIVLSLAVTVLWSFFLNSLGLQPGLDMGYVTKDYIGYGLIGLSLAFFALGWWRGAYPWMARLHPSLARAPKPAATDLFAEETRDAKVRMQLEDLAERRESLRRSIKDAERRMKVQSSDAKAHYEAQRDKARAELKKVEAELKVLEQERATELYG